MKWEDTECEPGENLPHHQFKGTTMQVKHTSGKDRTADGQSPQGLGDGYLKLVGVGNLWVGNMWEEV